MTRELQGKTAIVTGGSGGLGKAIARELFLAGASIFLVARNRDTLEAVRDEFGALDQRGIETFQADLMDLDAAQRCVDEAVARFGKLDILVNCAGSTKRGEFAKLTDEDWASGYGLKLHGSVRMCRAAWKHLVAQRGSVINIAGVSTHTPTADFTIGASVNSALLTFSKALADIGIADGVRVNAINPGYIDSDRLSSRILALSRERSESPDVICAELLRHYQVERFGLPHEVGQLAVFLASDKAAYIHGTAIDVDGGATRGA